MTPIIFRDLPGVAEVERQLDLRHRDRLLDDELEELPHLIDAVSQVLFGITERDTFYAMLPGTVRARFDRAGWDANFAPLSAWPRDPNAAWRGAGLDLGCAQGRGLHCVEVFGRQLICALNGLHPNARLVFAEPETRQAA